MSPLSRYRLLLSDGQYSNSFSMLATQLNNLIHENQLSQYSIIRVKKHVCNSNLSKKVVVILELEVLKPGSEVGERLGSPINIGADGKIQASANQKDVSSNEVTSSESSSSEIGPGPGRIRKLNEEEEASEKKYRGL